MGHDEDDVAGAMFSSGEVGALLSAVAFAADKHRRQRRKGTGGEAYINHPIGVAAILWEVGGVRDTATLVAALLHDTLEDTETTAAELEAQFGSEVLRLVQAVTDDKSLPKATRKQLQIEHAPVLAPQAKLIKLADKIHNVHDVGVKPPRSWSLKRKREYVKWADAVVAGLRGVNPALEAAYDVAAREARERFAAESGQPLKRLLRAD